jgi:hypothetical protein
VKRFADLTEQEILALAITNEDEDSRIYRGFAEGLREKYAASAKVFARWRTRRCATAPCYSSFTGRNSANTCR